MISKLIMAILFIAISACGGGSGGASTSSSDCSSSSGTTLGTATFGSGCFK